MSWSMRVDKAENGYVMTVTSEVAGVSTYIYPDKWELFDGLLDRVPDLREVYDTHIGMAESDAPATSE